MFVRQQCDFINTPPSTVGKTHPQHYRHRHSKEIKMITDRMLNANFFLTYLSHVVQGCRQTHVDLPMEEIIQSWIEFNFKLVALLSSAGARLKLWCINMHEEQEQTTSKNMETRCIIILSQEKDTFIFFFFLLREATEQTVRHFLIHCS